MSLKNSITTADYLPWSDMTRLVKQLFADEKYRMSLFIGCGAFFGLRVSDLKKFTWAMLLDNDEVTIREQKTGKRRTIYINPSFKPHIVACYTALHIRNRNEPCFISQKRTVYTTQRLNQILKEIKVQYNVDVKHFSCHSLRKCFGRQVVSSAGKDAEMALIKLGEIFNHASIKVTKKYLGIREEEIKEVYNSFTF